MVAQPSHLAQHAERGAGWRIFAGIMIMLVGFFNFIDGIVTILSPKYLYYYYTPNGDGTVTVHHLIFGGVTGWGWALLIIGIIQVLAALAIFGGSSWGAIVGIVVAVCNAIAQLMWIGVYPWWSIVIIAIDVLVIYGLAVYGFPRAVE
jgi:hypothetical protein